MDLGASAVAAPLRSRRRRRRRRRRSPTPTHAQGPFDADNSKTRAPPQGLRAGTPADARPGASGPRDVGASVAVKAVGGGGAHGRAERGSRGWPQRWWWSATLVSVRADGGGRRKRVMGTVASVCVDEQGRRGVWWIEKELEREPDLLTLLPLLLLKSFLSRSDTAPIAKTHNKTTASNNPTLSPIRSTPSPTSAAPKPPIDSEPKGSARGRKKGGSTLFVSKRDAARARALFLL